MQNSSQTFITRISRWLARPYREVGVLNTEFGALATCTGEVRKENQDRVVIANYCGITANDSFTVWLLCDGIGGLREGDVAAGQAIASILVGLVATRDIQKAGSVEEVIQEANRHVYNRFKEQGGCTLSLIVSSGSFSFATNVGDSRIYRREDQRVAQLSTDDTIGNQLRLIAGSGISATGGLFNHHLSQYLGIGGTLQLNAIPRFQLDVPENAILSSDGAHSLDSRVFERIIVSAPSPLETARRLVYVSKWCGGKDNASVVCIPSSLPTRSNIEPGLLQIWDSFGGLELFIERSLLQPPPKTDRPQKPEVEEKRQGMSPNLTTTSETPKTEATKKPRRKGAGKQNKPNPEVEIIENIEESAS